MGPVSGIVVFLIVWWTVLFVVLPFGVSQQSGGVEVGIKGAPERPRLKIKFIITTLLSIVIWGIILALVESDVISFRQMAKEM